MCRHTSRHATSALSACESDRLKFGHLSFDIGFLLDNTVSYNHQSSRAEREPQGLVRDIMTGGDRSNEHMQHKGRAY